MPALRSRSANTRYLTFAMEALELLLKMDFVVHRVILPRLGGFEG